jgi:hypothetical protein
MRFIFILSIFLAGCQKPAFQKSIYTKANGNTHSLHFLKEYPYPVDLMLAGGYKNSLYYTQKIVILSREKSGWVLVNCIFSPAVKVGESHYAYTRYPVRQLLADSILHVFISNKLIDIKDSDKGCEPVGIPGVISKGKIISCRKSHEATKELRLILKDRFILKEYIEPEFWQKTACCPANKDRQVFIQCYHALMQAR